MEEMINGRMAVNAYDCPSHKNPVLQTEPGESQLHTQKKHRGRGKGVDHGPPQHADGT